MSGDLYIALAGTAKVRKADSLDREYLGLKLTDRTYGKIIVNDEKLEDGSTLLTVTQRAWEEMSALG